MVTTRRLIFALALLTVVAPGAPGRAQRGTDPASVVATASAAFACDVLDRLADRGGNVVFSPLGLSSALALTLGGARGNTARQLARALSLPGPDVEAGFADLLGATREAGRGAVRIAAALWVQKGRPLVPAFVERCAARYGAVARTVDFAGGPVGAREAINAWARDQTGQRVTALLGPGALGPRTRLVLTSAVHLEQPWQRRFDISQTIDGLFRTDRGSSVPAKLMRLEGTFASWETRDLQAIELPYRGRRFALWVVLPRRARDPARPGRWFPARAFAAMLDGARECGVSVTLPRFQLASEHRLARTLASMGVRDLFEDAADLSGMSPEPLKVDDVVQAARIRVDEAGTEAAAATAVTVIEKSAGPARTFVADRPFLFFVVESSSRAVLFAGRVSDPR